MNIKMILIIVLFLLQGLSAVKAADEKSAVGYTKMTYFGTNQKAILHPEVASEYQFEIKVFNLDGLKNLEAQVTKDLPADRNEAERMAQERLANIDESETMRMMQGIAYLIRWDIKKLPAMVFGEGEYVVYGVTDTAIAIKRYMNSRKR